MRNYGALTLNIRQDCAPFGAGIEDVRSYQSQGLFFSSASRKLKSWSIQRNLVETGIWMDLELIQTGVVALVRGQHIQCKARSQPHLKKMSQIYLPGYGVKN